MQLKANRLAFRIAITYAIVAGGWILLSDELVGKFVSNPDKRVILSIVKAWGFVIVTGALLYQLLLRLLAKWDLDLKEQGRQATDRHESEEYYRKLFAVETNSIFLLDRQTYQILDVNPAAEKMYGFSRDEFLRLKATEVSAEPEKTRNAIAADLKHIPLRLHRRKDGTVFPVEISYNNFEFQGHKFHLAAVRDITQRKKLESELQISEARFHSLFEHMNEGFAYCQMIYDEGGKPKDFFYLAVNPMFSAITGLHDVIGKRVTEVIPGVRESDPELFEIYGRVASTGTPERLDHYIGALKMWFDLSVYSAEQDCFVVMFNVITERKESEDRLRKLSRVVEQSPASVVITDVGGVIEYVNRAFTQVTGYTHEEAVGQNPRMLKSGKIPGETYRELWANITSGRTWSGELQNRRKDGTLFWEWATISPLLDNNGKATHYIAIKEDITARKQEADDLRWKTAMLEAQADAAPDGILVVASSGRRILVNRNFLKLFKVPEAIARDDDDSKLLAHVVSLTRNPKQFAERVAQIYSHPDEIAREEFELADGTIVDRYSAPVSDRAGTILGRIWTFFDITKNRQLEAQFRQSQKMDAIGQLASGVAHDFNNILAVIQLQAGLLQAEPGAPARQLDSANEIEKAAQRAANLTHQLLLFGRRQAMQQSDLNLNEAITNITKMLQRILGEDVQMQIRFSPQQLLIHADPGMIDQVLLNLTVNARDAMPKGGQLVIETSAAVFDELVVAQSQQARAGSFACLSVSDTGFGIPPETLPRIFEPFFTTKEVGKGSGLGLATSFGIIQQHQGWINVYSEVGLGTTFRIYLPRLSKSRGSKAADSPAAHARGGNETILLVEDDLAVRASVRSALSRLGYRVLEASTGNETLEVWRQHHDKISLLLTDLVMPGGMTGKELAGRLLREEPNLSVVYVSGYSPETAGKDLAMTEGVNFLHKPFEAHKLAQIVRESLDRS